MTHKAGYRRGAGFMEKVLSETGTARYLNLPVQFLESTSHLTRVEEENGWRTKWVEKKIYSSRPGSLFANQMAPRM